MKCFVDGQPCGCNPEKLDECIRDPIRIGEDHREEYETIERFRYLMGDENEIRDANT